jgi:hypothetical protein
MNSFIHSVAEYIFRTHGSEMGEVCVVLPNRRAGLFFSRAVSELTEVPVWSPRVVAIREFVETLTGQTVSDELLLVKELYEICRKRLNRDESFESFYPWGVMLLGDFDDVDKYRVKAHDLFRNLKAIRDLSSDLSYLNEEQIELIRQFWENFQEEGKGHAPLFLEFWEKLPVIYDDFRSVLKEKDLAYEGMLYRELAEQLLREEKTEIPCSMVYFVGFNALTPAEETLFTKMKQQGNARFFWDYDQAYLEHAEEGLLGGHDAGRFISRYLKMFPPPADLDIFNNFSDPDKTIEVWSSPNRTMQSWVVKEVLEKWQQEPPVPDEKIAVVLADEQLLLPVLHALPAGAGAVNVTMGYPLKASPVYAFFVKTLQLLRNRKRSGEGNNLYYHADVISLMHNPLVKKPERYLLHQWEKEIIKKNKIYLQAGEIPAGDFSIADLEKDDEPAAWTHRLLDLLFNMVVPDLPEEEEKGVNLNLEVFYRLSLLVTRFNDFVTTSSLYLTPKGYISLLLHLVEKESVSFYGEPLAGMQVMGILETRLLDFDRLIILSVNEGDLPAAGTVASYIPYHLRKGFKLPAWEHRDSLYAYYFFRLIQRAGKVVLVYHTDSDSETRSTGEKSRFISQLHYLSSLKLRVKNLYYRPGIIAPGEVVVEKEPKIMERMIRLYTQERALSPSALNTYLNCRLAFYYRYVAGIREAEEMSEEVDHALFGQLIHKALEMLYDPVASHLPADKQITPELLAGMKNRILENTVDKAMQMVLFGEEKESDRSFTPIQTIVRTMVIKYVRKVLDYDAQLAPLKPLHVEKSVRDMIPVTVGEKTIAVAISGTIDRVDSVAGTIRIVDYKTGGGDHSKMSFENIPALFDRDKKTQKKEIFQILMYAMMYASEHPEDPPPLPVLYFLKIMFGGSALQQLKAGPSGKKSAFTFKAEAVKNFREHLTGLLQELFDPSVPFDRTPHEEHCKYCPYRSICEKE